MRKWSGIFSVLLLSLVLIVSGQPVVNAACDDIRVSNVSANPDTVNTSDYTVLSAFVEIYDCNVSAWVPAEGRTVQFQVGPNYVGGTVTDSTGWVSKDQFVIWSTGNYLVTATEYWSGAYDTSSLTVL